MIDEEPLHGEGPATKAKPKAYTEDEIAAAYDLEAELRTTVGKTIPATEYPAKVVEWNRAIATIHGVEFDTSGDREGKGLVTG